MKGLLADINIQGQVDVLIAELQAEPWKLYWDSLSLEFRHFSDVGLALSASDSQVWQVCQERELVLITENRNSDHSESLEATIRAYNTPRSLPVFTIGATSRLRFSREYRDRVVETLLDLLLRIDSLRGTGRLFLP